MKRFIYFFSLIILTSILFSSCQPCIDGMGPVSKETIEFKKFTKLDLRIPAKLTLKTGNDHVATITSNENILKNIRAEVRGNTLVIGSKNCIGKVDKLEIELIVSSLDEIVLNGSGSIKSVSQLEADDMELKINGSGNILTEVFTSDLRATINGSGNIIINGTVKDADIEISGSGDFKGIALDAFTSDIEINGSGDVRLNVKNDLSVKINGSGSVYYLGEPEIRTKISGSGEVKKLRSK